VLETFAIAMMLCALAPAVLFCVNLRRYLPPNGSGEESLPGVSVLIPARDEEDGIEAAVQSVLASRGVRFEVIVMDDSSTDRTAALVEAMARKDKRIRLERALDLPREWNGKQHACWLLARAAQHELLCFVDADVRLEPEALSRMTAFLDKSSAALVSGFPRQITQTWLEWLLLPLIHFVLLGFLPMEKMRKTTDPAFAAGCGQFLLVRRDAYFACGGHAEIKETMHDGLLLPKLFRQHGYRTDLADLTALATCRMYRSARQVWSGLAKNATEGIAAPVRILPVSLLLMMGQVLPFCFAAWFLLHGGLSLAAWIYLLVAMAGGWLPRALAARRFRQDWRGAVLHPIGITFLLAIQWYAFARRMMGRTVSWKDRAYAGE
jgi:glycosyl transferase family 2